MNKEINLQNDVDMDIGYVPLLATILPCPFCGQKPRYEQGYVPPYIELMCQNDDCYVRPSLTIEVECTPYDETETVFRPEFEKHYKELRDKWNRRL